MAGNEADGGVGSGTRNQNAASAATAGVSPISGLTSGGQTSSQWPDLYSLLGVPPGAEMDLLRRRIREAYMEAMANSDHRNLERRMHYQAMMERVLPQCRRILLDEQLRAGYDRQSALHRAGDAHAMEYAAFVNTLGQGKEEEDDISTVPGKRPDEKRHDEPRAHEIAQARVVLESLEASSADAMPFRPTATNRAPQQTMPGTALPPAPHDAAVASATTASANSATAGGAAPHNIASFLEHIPTEITATESDAAQVPPAPPAPSAPPSQTHVASPAPATAPQRSLPTPPTSIESINRPTSTTAPLPGTSRTASAPGQAAPVSTAAIESPVNAANAPGVANAVGAANDVGATNAAADEHIMKPQKAAAQTGATTSAVPEVDAIASVSSDSVSSDSVSSDSVSSGTALKGEVIPDATTLDEADSVVRARTLYTPRVSVGETAKNGWKRDSETRGKRVLSETSIRLLTGIVAAALMFAILHLTDTSGGGAAVAPMRVTYASELQPFMERAEREFEASAEGAGVDIQLSPVDSRDAMHRTLENNGTPPDVWIPSESLWRQQYDEVASKHKRQRIAVARPLLLSPTVLVARSDRAALLRRRFPSRVIPTWEALRAAVVAGAPNHFGLTDPQKSGSGAIVRMFMAREWCERNNIEWSADTVARPALWKWMKGFEDNVPGYAGLAGDMVQDLALGTADRYWWAIAYESDALRWMSQKKPVEIFYLPRTNYADHPFCYIERPNMEPQSAQARALFDKFLRGPQMQQALLQHGFRPTAIEITSKVEGNPFTRADYKARGLRTAGFRTDEKINYRILNSLNVQWSKRF